MPDDPKSAADALPDPAPHRPGETTVAKDAQLAHKLPSERDESADSQQGAPQQVIQQAYDDVERGLVDTSRAATTDQTYDRNFRATPEEAARKSPDAAEKKPG